MDLKVKKGIKYFSQSPSLSGPVRGGQGEVGLLSEVLSNFRRYSNFPDVAFNLEDEQGTHSSVSLGCFCVRVSVCSAPARTFIRFTMPDN